jgi:hypothetical protein
MVGVDLAVDRQSRRKDFPKFDLSRKPVMGPGPLVKPANPPGRRYRFSRFG